MGGSESPIVVWEEATRRIALANELAARFSGYPLRSLVGARVEDLVETVDDFNLAATALESGVIDRLRGRSTVLRRDGTRARAFVWSRAVEVDGRRGGLSLVVPVEEMPRLGRDPTRPWRELIPIALGALDGQGRIAALSADIGAVLGGNALDYVGLPLLSLVHPADSDSLRESVCSPAPSVRSIPRVRLRGRDGGLVRVSLLVSSIEPAAPRYRVFAVVGREPGVKGSDRVRELELRLRRIGAEVRAAGVLDTGVELPAVEKFPQLAELTTRQWEILNRILQGQRVPTIAADLFLSPSTVRNHLTTIFRKLGVHSQPELLSLLQRTAQSSEHSA